MFPATIFDFNGVLVDDEAVHLAAFRDVLGPLGIELSDADYADRYLGFDDLGAFRAILGDRGRPPSPAELFALVQAKRPHYRWRAEEGLVVFEGACELVRHLAARGPLAIVSGALRDEIDFALSRMGVRGLFPIIVSAEDTQQCKPHPEGYEIAVRALAKRLGLEAARRALVIEDSVAGIKAAKGAFLPCLAVAHSYPKEALDAAGADLVVTHLSTIDDEMLGELAARLSS